MATGFGQLIEHLQQAGGGLSDGQLLGRFVATRDEASFAALVRRHGPMVLGVCRRVLRHGEDAEDAFQATFLVLAQKARSVLKGESVGCWLHGVAYHTALRAGAAIARRRARERQVKDMPQPQVAPAETRDWLPLLDRELNRLPPKYRAAVVLCDLEGRPRREAARQLGVPEGTLSSRLASARKMLAKRLAGCGLAVSGGALAAALAEGAASASVPAALVGSTAKAAALVAAGQVAAVATPAVVLMREVSKAMLMHKLRLVLGAVVMVVALGAVGVGYRAGGAGEALAEQPGRPRSELDALRRENELLKLNLEVVLEKVRAQENELRELRGRPAGGGMARPGGTGRGMMAPGYGMPGSSGGVPAGTGGFPGMAGPGGAPAAGGSGALMPPGGTGGYPGMPGSGGGAPAGSGRPGPGGMMPPGAAGPAAGAGAPGMGPEPGMMPGGPMGGPGGGAAPRGFPGGGGKPGQGGPPAGDVGPGGMGGFPGMGMGGFSGGAARTAGNPDPVKEAEAALKQLREARDADGQRRATDALEKALEKIKQQRH